MTDNLHIEIPRSVIEGIARQVFEESFAQLKPQDEEAEKIARSLVQINAKQFITIPELAYLFGCSRGYVDTLLEKAEHGTTEYPIPFCSLDGLIVFDRLKVLAWAEESKQSKPGQRKQGGKRRHLKVAGR